MKPAKVAVVILNYNTRDLLEQFVPLILQSDWPNLEVVVTDNASSDGSVDMIKEKFPQVTVIENPGNEGYAGGYNLALQQVKADYFVLINSDIEVTEGWLNPVISSMELNPDIAAAQPKIKDYHNREYFEYAGASGGFIDRFGYPFCRGRLFDTLEKDEGQYDDMREVFWATGACLFVRAEAFFKVGGLDTAFFAHMEEIDLCWRMRNSGYKIMVVPESEVYHMGGATLTKANPRKTFLNFRNGLLLLLKNLPVSQGLRIIFIRLLLDHIAAYRFLFKGEIKHFFAVAKAHAVFLFRLPHWLRLRKTAKVHAMEYRTDVIYPSSIVWSYFAKSKKHFHQLDAWPKA